MKYFSDCFIYVKNPSPIGGGYTIMDEDNNLLVNEKILQEGLTNNEAELLGVLNALKIAENGDIVSTDSMNTIRWIENIAYYLEHPNKKKSIKRARKDLDNIKLEAYQLMIKKHIKLIHEPREKNLAGIWNEETGLDDSLPEPDLSWI
jgi:ribonuclease HI